MAYDGDHSLGNVEDISDVSPFSCRISSNFSMA